MGRGRARAGLRLGLPLVVELERGPKYRESTERIPRCRRLRADHWHRSLSAWRPGFGGHDQGEAHDESSHRHHQHDPAATIRMVSRAATDRPRYLCARDPGERERRHGPRLESPRTRGARQPTCPDPCPGSCPAPRRARPSPQFTWRWCRARSTTPSTRSTAGISRISTDSRLRRGQHRKRPRWRPPRTTCSSASEAGSCRRCPRWSSIDSTPSMPPRLQTFPAAPTRPLGSRPGPPRPRQCSRRERTTADTCRSRSPSATRLASGVRPRRRSSATRSHGWPTSIRSSSRALRSSGRTARARSRATPTRGNTTR